MRIASSVVLLLCVMMTPRVVAGAMRPPNLVLILADDLGYGDLGCYGQPTLKTPRLDRMADEGIRFTQFYAGSTVCAPSRAVLLTGRHLGRNPIRGNNRSLLGPDDTTFVQLLQRAGYRTACIGKWGVGHPLSLDDPQRKGFDAFFGYVNMWHAHNFYPEFLIRNGRSVALRNVVAPKWKPMQDLSDLQAGRGVAITRVDYAPKLFLDEALQFIDRHHENRFFLFLSLNTPHANNEAGAKGMEVPDVDPFTDYDWPEPEKGFARMIYDLDRDVGRVLDRLARHGIDRDTLVIFSSDNGPHNEGGHDHAFFDSNGPLRGYKRDLYEGGIRVPTLARWPGTIEPQRVSDHIAYFGDFFETVRDLIDVEPADNAQERDSISFLPTLVGGHAHQRRHDALYWEFYEKGSAQAVRFGRWKAVRRPMLHGSIELYDLNQDIGEANNVASQHADVVRRAEALMQDAHRPHATLKPPLAIQENAKADTE